MKGGRGGLEINIFFSCCLKNYLTVINVCSLAEASVYRWLQVLMRFDWKTDFHTYSFILVIKFLSFFQTLLYIVVLLYIKENKSTAVLAETKTKTVLGILKTLWKIQCHPIFNFRRIFFFYHWNVPQGAEYSQNH